MRYLFAFFFAATATSQAAVYSPTGEVLRFSLEAEVTFSPSGGEIWLDKASEQLHHTFGIFQSPGFTRKFGINHRKIGGVGALRLPATFTRLSDTRLSSGKRKIKYRAEGEVLLLKKVAEEFLQAGYFEIPLPVDLDDFYDERCTDEYYDSISDFWYFFDIFREGCQYLGRPPYAAPVRFSISGKAPEPKSLQMRLDRLRAHNGNGPTFRIDVIHGFAESSFDPTDQGRTEYQRFHQYLEEEQGFQKKSLSRHFNRPLWLFTKSVEIEGKTVDVEIRSLLVNSAADSRTVTFAKFVREAVEEADVIYYAGHSGLGGNLDIPLLEEKAGGFRFDKRKRQIFVFDSCASFSYYLDHFRSEKTEKSIDIVTNGLSSYFDTNASVLQTFIEQILDPNSKDKGWNEVLTAIEQKLGGVSYLINVGGLD